MADMPLHMGIDCGTKLAGITAVAIVVAHNYRWAKQKVAGCRLVYT